jgi:hypothetical protein
MTRLTIKELQRRIGAKDDGDFGKLSRAALSAFFSNPGAPTLSNADFQKAAADLGVPAKYMMAVRKVEAPRGPFDALGRPSNLYERHVANRNTDPVGRLAHVAPDLFGPPYGPGGYGPYSAQFDKLGRACAYDPEAAFRACSWGAFQVLGENAVKMGYPSAFDMVVTLRASEMAHLDSFVRYVKAFGLADELRACRPGDPKSCIPFVRGYNGPGYAEFNYHTKFAAELV